MSADALRLLAWIDAHGKLLAAVALLGTVLKVSADVRAVAVAVVQPIRKVAGTCVLWLVREKVDERTKQHEAVIARLDGIAAQQAWATPEIAKLAIRVELQEDAASEYREATVTLARREEQWLGIADDIARIATSFEGFCAESRTATQAHGERLARLEGGAHPRRRHTVRRGVDPIRTDPPTPEGL